MPTPHNLPEPVTRNASDPRDVRDGARLEKLREERWKRALAAVFATPEGRIVFSELITRCGIFKSSWTRDATIHFNEGVRSVGLMIRGELVDTSEELYLTMEREGWLWNRQFNEMVESTHKARTQDREVV